MHKLPRHKTIRVFEGFAGYGGATFGLRRSGVRYKVVGYSENDPDAIELYHYNFPDVKNYEDITKIDPTAKNFPDFDLFTGGFPCQPFSTVGKRQGQEDERGRGTLFGDIIRICEVKQPKYILLENVKDLHGFVFLVAANALGIGAASFWSVSGKRYSGKPDGDSRNALLFKV